MSHSEVDAIAELDEAIAAHWLWLRAEGIPTPGYDGEDGSGARSRPEPPKELLARLGPVEAMLAAEQARVSKQGDNAWLIGVVLDSVCRLSRFRNGSIGLELVREDFERRRAEGSGFERDGEDLSLDALHLAVVEKNLADFARRADWVHGSLKRFRVACAKRAREYARGGFHPGLHGVARAMFLSKWIEGRLVDLLLDIERFREETGGSAGVEPFGQWQVPSARTLRRVQAECIRLVKESGASPDLVLKLFPSSQLEQPERRSGTRVRRQARRRSA